MPPVLDEKGTAKTEVSPMSGVGTGALAPVREADGGQLVQPEEGFKGDLTDTFQYLQGIMKKTE